MSASANDKITQSMNGGSPVVTTVSSPRSIGGSSLSAVALTNWPTATRVFFTTYKKTTAGLKDFSTVTSWWAIVSGTTLGTLTYMSGVADAGNAEGDFIEMGPTDAWAEALYEFGTKEHATDGTHDATKVGMLAGTQTFTGAKTFSGTLNATSSISGITPDKFTVPYAFRVFLSTAQNSSAGTNVRLACDGLSYDTGSNVDRVTNKGRFTATADGLYHFDAAFQQTLNGTTQVGISLFKNGSLASTGQTLSSTAFSSTANTTLVVSDTLQLVATDYIEVMVFCSGSVAIATGSAVSYFSGFVMSKA